MTDPVTTTIPVRDEPAAAARAWAKRVTHPELRIVLEALARRFEELTQRSDHVTSLERRLAAVRAERDHLQSELEELRQELDCLADELTDSRAESKALADTAAIAAGAVATD